MVADPLREQLHAELRAIRLGIDALSMERIAATEHLVDFLGHGSVEQAFTALLDILDKHGAEDNAAIHAYFATCGQGLDGDTLEARLLAYAAKYYVDARTALRRSDRGAERLSHIIRDRYLYERPLGNIYLAQVDDDFSFSVLIEVPDHSKYRRPHVYVNDTLQEDRRFELHDSTTDELRVNASETFQHIALDLNSPRGEVLAAIRVYWIMPIWPSWMLGAHFADNRLFAKLSTDRDSSARITIHWAPE